MTAAGRAEVEELIGLAIWPAVSVLMPTHRAGPAIRQDPIRLKNLLREAGERLMREGLQEPEVETVLRPGKELLDDRAFWRHQADGLILFLGPHLARMYSLTRPARERAVVGERFYVTPLIGALAEDERFYVLALSQKDVRLVEATRDTAVEVDLGDLPRTVAEAVPTEAPGQRLQQHVGTIVGAERGLVFHGHGGGRAERKEAVHQFLHRVDRGIESLLSPRDAPLVVAAVDYLLPMYREVSALSGLLAEGITGNPEGFSAQALGARAWPIVAGRPGARRARAAGRYRELAGSERTSADLPVILRAAQDGRVDELFVAEDAEERWGTLDPDSGTVTTREEPGPGAEDLLNVAAIHVFDRRGTVWVVDRESLPDGTALCAIFRY